MTKPPASTVFGPALHSLRTAQGMTLDRLAAESGLDKSYLSRLERGQKSPSIATVLKLSDALDVTMDQLFGMAVPDDAVRVTRANDRVRPAKEDDAASFEALIPGDGLMEAFVLHPGPEFGTNHAEHAGEELFFVLDGQIEIRFPDRTVALAEGDSIQFPGHLPHSIRRVGEPASALVAIAKEKRGT